MSDGNINLLQTIPVQHFNPQDKKTAIFGTKKFIFSVLFITIFAIASFIFLVSSKKQSMISPSANPYPAKSFKMWEITFVYDTEKQTLSVKSAIIKTGTATASNLGLSPYKLLVFNKNNNVIFNTDIHITEGILYDIDGPPNATSSPIIVPSTPKTFENVVYIPLFQSAKKIEVTKNGIKILEFTLPKVTGFNLINQTFAVNGPACTTNLKIVFISDGYNSESQFYSDAQEVVKKYISLSPYSEKPDIFDFKMVYNTIPLGCAKNGVLYTECLSSLQTIIMEKNIIFGKYPELQGIDGDHLKFIVLADAQPELFGGLLYMGAMEGVGGVYGVFETRDRDKLPTVASHEVLGHAVGYLYDRYVYSSGPNSQERSVFPESNCSRSQQGASFWQSINGGGAYQGCTSEYLFGPYPRDCGTGGTRESIMSLVSCGSSEFDPVEQAWIRTNVISKYQSCSGSSPSASFPPTSTSIPTLVPRQPTSIQEPVVTPTSTSSVPTTVPTSASLTTYDCYSDPNCRNSGQGNIQLCPLVCTPK